MPAGNKSKSALAAAHTIDPELWKKANTPSATAAMGMKGNTAASSAWVDAIHKEETTRRKWKENYYNNSGNNNRDVDADLTEALQHTLTREGQRKALYLSEDYNPEIHELLYRKKKKNNNNNNTVNNNNNDDDDIDAENAFDPRVHGVHIPSEEEEKKNKNNKNKNSDNNSNNNTSASVNAAGNAASNAGALAQINLKNNETRRQVLDSFYNSRNPRSRHFSRSLQSTRDPHNATHEALFSVKEKEEKKQRAAAADTFGNHKKGFDKNHDGAWVGFKHTDTDPESHDRGAAGNSKNTKKDSQIYLEARAERRSLRYRYPNGPQTQAMRVGWYAAAGGVDLDAETEHVIRTAAGIDKELTYEANPNTMMTKKNKSRNSNNNFNNNYSDNNINDNEDKDTLEAEAQAARAFAAANAINFAPNKKTGNNDVRQYKKPEDEEHAALLGFDYQPK